MGADGPGSLPEVNVEVLALQAAVLCITVKLQQIRAGLSQFRIELIVQLLNSELVRKAGCHPDSAGASVVHRLAMTLHFTALPNKPPNLKPEPAWVPGCEMRTDKCRHAASLRNRHSKSDIFMHLISNALNL